MDIDGLIPWTNGDTTEQYQSGYRDGRLDAAAGHCRDDIDSAAETPYLDGYRDGWRAYQESLAI